MVTVADLKEWLRIDHDHEDALLDRLISAAYAYLYNATGRDWLSEATDLSDVLVLMLAADWYEHREATGQVREALRPTVRGILTQLGYSYPEEETA